MIAARGGIQLFLFSSEAFDFINYKVRFCYEAQMGGPVQCLTARDEGHVFRSKLIDVFARLEKWTVKVLRDAPPDPSGKGLKIPLLLGKRLDRVKAVAATHPQVFRHPGNLADLLKRLEPYNALRTTLVHSELVMNNVKGGTLHTFDNPIAVPRQEWIRRISIRNDEFATIIVEVTKLVDEITRQGGQARLALV